MSLAAKLNKMSSELSEAKRANQEKEREDSLLPVKEKIKSLETLKNSLDLLHNSLQPRTEKSAGLQMPEYASDIKGRLKQQEEQLDSLVASNQEALAEIGVKDRQDLMDHPEFSSEEEVKSYRESLKEAGGLSESDEALKQRLSDLGVELPSEEFSYQSAAEAVAEKSKAVEKELLQEKIKVPELRVEVVDKIAAEISEKNLPAMTFEEKQGSQFLKFGKTDEETVELVYDAKDRQARVRADRYSDRNWLNSYYQMSWDKELASLSSEYGSELAKEALRQAWRKKISEQVIDGYAKKNGDARYIKHGLEVSLAQKEAVYQRLRQLQQTKAAIEDLWNSKAQEFGVKLRALDLRAMNVFYSKDNKDLLQDMNGVEPFPPKYDYQKLDSLSAGKLKAAQDFLEKLRLTKDSNELTPFYNINADEGPQKDLQESTLFLSSLDFKWPNGAPEHHQQETWRRLDDLKKSKQETVDGVLEQMNRQLAEEEKAAGALADKMDLILDIKDRQREYAKEYEQVKDGLPLNNNNNFSHVKDYKKIEDSLRSKKRDAITLVHELQNKERLIADICARHGWDNQEIRVIKSNLSIDGISIVIAEQVRDIENHRQTLLSARDRISDLNNELKSLDQEERNLGDKPRFFSGGWEDKQKELQAKKDRVAEQLRAAEMERDRENKYLDEAQGDMQSLRVDSRNYEITSSLFVDGQEVSGRANEVFQSISDQLTSKFVDKSEIPASLQKAAAEYQKLVDSLFSASQSRY